MPARLTLNVFSPLPPAPTEIANNTAATLGPLGARAEVRLWTAAADWRLPPIRGVSVHRYGPGLPPGRALNAADANIYHLGNNAQFHQPIHRVARAAPGVVVLHDVKLQQFFAAYGAHPGTDRDWYVDAMARAHGPAARAAAIRFTEGRLPIEALIDDYPMVAAALDGALLGLVHNADALAALPSGDAAPVPVHALPLPYGFGPRPVPRPPVAPDAPLHLVAFGHLGRNRRLDAIIRALAARPDRGAYRLDVFGRIEAEAETRALIGEHGLEAEVTLHGYVPEATLDAAIAGADLVFNLRWPSMGEASASQLRIWANAAPSLVTRTAWYASLPPDTVAFVDPDSEDADLARHLAALRRDPAGYRALGARGRARLEDRHDPEQYAEALLARLDDLPALRRRAAAAALARATARTLVETVGPDLAREIAEELGDRVAEISA